MSPAPTTGASNTPGSGEVLLQTLNPLSGRGIINFSTAPQQIAGTAYQSSVRFTATPDNGEVPYLVYDVAGYNFLTATVGVPDGVTDAAGDTMTITFFRDDTNYKQGAVKVSAGQPQSINLNLQGSAELVIECAATGSAGLPVAMDVAFGDAVLSAS